MFAYKFCPRCAGNLVLKSEEFFECQKCGYKLFLKSTPCVSVFPVKADKFLITRRAQEPQRGAYDSVGGFLKYGEEPLKGAIRETLEEIGVRVKILDQLGIYIDDYEYQNEVFRVFNVVYVAELPANAKPRPLDDAASLEWFPIDAPPKKMGFKWLTPAIKDLQNWYRPNRK